MSRRRLVVVVVCALVLAIAASVGVVVRRAPATNLRQWVLSLFAGPGGERAFGYATLVDEDGSVLLRTGLLVRRGDVFIDPQDLAHRVVRVVGDRVETVAESVPASEWREPGIQSAGHNTDGGIALAGGGASRSGLDPGVPGAPREPRAPGAAVSDASGERVDGTPGFGSDRADRFQESIPLGTARQVIVLYHTHSDESYAPDDGAASIYAGGGIYRVGEAMADALTAAGFTVVHDRAAHDPHDGGAYPRSRRTLLHNLQYGPALAYDIHRDSAPASEYLTTIDGRETARILIVVGGRNPLYRGNLSVANRLKSTADSLYPGLMRGILVAGGSYNQDLTPGGILLEMGTETVTRTSAETAATLWADVTAAYLGPPGPGPSDTAP